MLELRRLRYLEAVYHYRSFTKASEELFVTQSTLSIAIKNLEEELGVKLLVRGAKGIDFTPEGEEFILYVQHILRDCQNAENRMAELSDSKKHILHLGLSPTLGQALQAYLYSAAFAEQFPLASIFFDEGFLSYHIEKIKQELLDLSYNALPIDGNISEFRLIPITQAEVFAVMLPTHQLASFERIPISKLAGESIALLDDKSHIRFLLMQQFGKAGIVPCIRSSHNQVFCMLNMIRQGNLIGFVNASDQYTKTYLKDGGMIIRPLLPSITFDVGFIIKKSHPLPLIGRKIIEIVRSLQFHNTWG